jgi:ribosomal protein L31E
MYLGSAALALKYVAELEKQHKVQSLKRAKTAIDKVHETVSETVKKKLAEH